MRQAVDASKRASERRHTVVMTSPAALWRADVMLGVLEISVLAMAVAILGILVNDASLRRHRLPASSALEWERSTARVARIVERYRTAGLVPLVVGGILLDTLALVPAYSTFLAIGSFWSARSLTSYWATIAVVGGGWAGVAAGFFDFLENTGILMEVGKGRASVAPWTKRASSIKWMLFFVALGVLVRSSSTQWICAHVCR
jgi:hypothetical protein